jgi:acylphosphatase
MKTRGHFLISGRVQGVCFRMYAQQEAQRLGLSGWVRNLADGQVETIAEGAAADVAAYLQWCRRGPAHAVVRGIAEEYGAATGEFSGFAIAY